MLSIIALLPASAFAGGRKQQGRKQQGKKQSKSLIGGCETMKKKCFVAVLLCLLILGNQFRVSAVAADGSEPKDDADVLEVYGWVQLEAAVLGRTFDGQPVEANRIRLIADAVSLINGSSIKVNRDLTIDLNGYRIDLQYANNHVIEVSNGVTLTIVDNSAEKTGIITGGRATDGGGIYVHENGTLIFRGGTITGNESTLDGGGVYVNGTMQMTGGKISGNTADSDGGGIHVGKGGTLIFDGGVISDNKATKDGGGVRVSGTLTCSDNAAKLPSAIENNSAGETGGGVYVDSDGALHLAYATVSGNTAKNGGGLNVHLGEDTPTGKIEHCTITGNTATGSGGGIRMSKSGRTLLIESSTVADNTAGEDGGGIYAREGAVSMDQCTISGNTAEKGGGVKNCGTTTLSGCIITGNIANSFGGGVCNIKEETADKTDMTIHSCIISDNIGSKGGGVYSNGTLAINGSTVIGESVSKGGEVIPGNTAEDCGGGIFITCYNVHNLPIPAQTSIQDGLRVEGNLSDSAENVYLDQFNVLTCTGSLNGARIGVDLYSGTGTVTECYGTTNENGIPRNQFFAAEGYDILVENSEVTFTSDWYTVKSKIESLQNGKSYTLANSSVAAPTQEMITIDGQKSVTVNLNGFTLNRHRLTNDADGHVFEVCKGSTLIIEDGSGNNTGKITGGWATDGGGIYVHEGGTLIFKGGTITGNKVSSDGSGVYVNGTMKMMGGVIAGNTADDDGGGIHVEKGGLLIFDGGIISDNKAKGDGGGVSISGTLTCSDNATELSSAIENNSAGETGGGVYVDSDGALHLAYATVSGNTAADGGGLNVHLGKDTPTGKIEHCTITDNRTPGSGGGIRMSMSGRTLLIISSTIADNMAGEDGGGIYAREGAVSMDQCTISGNSAGKGGGGVNVKGVAVFTATNTKIEKNEAVFEEGGGLKNCGTATLSDCTITGNIANSLGGGVCNIRVDEDDQPKLTIHSCIISDNSASNGGGVYSNCILTVSGDTVVGESASKGGEVIPGNTATGCGGGIFITSYVKNLLLMPAQTSIQDGLRVTGNFSHSADNVYLDQFNVLTCTESLQGARIGVDLYSGTGTVTEYYRVKNLNGIPGDQFFTAVGYGIVVENGEVTFTSDWKTVKSDIESLSNGDTYTLSRSSAAAESDSRIEITGRKSVTVDLNGYTLNRNRLSIAENGHIFEVYEGSTLTIVDSRTTGTITGGWSGYGGAVYVHEGGTLNICAGSITGNKADSNGGGIYLKEGAVLNLQAGMIHGNTAGKYGGGVYLNEGAEISAEGSPVVQDNFAIILGNNIFLPTGGSINITNALKDKAKIGVTLENDWGKFTSGYSAENGAADPGMFFASDEDFQVLKDNGEAAFGMDTFGGTDDEAPFIDRENQMRADTDTLNGRNWMAGISGERYLNEINLPGAHDAGMKNVQRIGVAYDLTSTLGKVLGIGYKIGADLALTQTSYIDRQLKDGARVFDLRLTDRYKERHEYSLKPAEYDWEDDYENVWVCHGDSQYTGCYLACNRDDALLRFVEVLDWVKDFLMKHPTETVILHIRPVSTESGHSDTIYNRIRAALEESTLSNNPSTGEPFLYNEPGSGYFAPYTHMPKLADCRGKIVLWFEYQGGVDRCGGFTTKGLYGENYYDPTNHKLTASEQIKSITKYYNNKNGGDVWLPENADTNCDFLWHWELSCTGESDTSYYIGGIALGKNPIDIANKVNPALVGNEKLFGPRITGQYIGWVKMDAFEAKYAEAIWRTNFFDGLQYCTVTVQSGVDDPGFPTQTYRLLKGTTVTIPGNIYKNPHPCEGLIFAGWTGSDPDTFLTEGDTYTIDHDVTFTAAYTFSKPRFMTHSLVLSGQIGVNFFMDLPAIDGVNYAESYMTFEISGKGTVPSDPVPYDPTHTNAKSTYYGFSCYVNSIQMADTIIATFHYGDGLTVSEEYSIKKYIASFDTYIAEHPGVYDDETVNLVHALADYGHYVQPFLSAARGWTLGDGEDQYAEMDLFYAQSYDIDAVKTAVADYAIDRTLCADIEKVTYSLLMDSNTAIYLYFKPVADYSGSFTVNGYMATKQKDGRYLVKIPNIGAHKLGDPYTVIVTTANGESTVTVSALSYVKGILDAEAYQNNTAAQYAAAIYFYYDAAIKYKTSH